MSNIYSSANSYIDKNGEKEDYSHRVNKILDTVFVSASRNLVCGERSNIVKANINLQIARGKINNFFKIID